MDIPYHSGFLYKKSKTNGSKWLKRHFRWNGETLTYHHSQQANSPVRQRIDASEILRIVVGTPMNAHPDGNTANYVFHIWLTGSKDKSTDTYVLPDLKFSTNKPSTSANVSRSNTTNTQSSIATTGTNDDSVTSFDTFTERIMELAATSEVEREYWVKLLGEVASEGVFEPVFMNTDLGKIGSKLFQIVQPMGNTSAAKEVIHFSKDGTPVGRSVLKTNGTTNLDVNPLIKRTVRILRARSEVVSESTGNLPMLRDNDRSSISGDAPLDGDSSPRTPTRSLRTLIPLGDSFSAGNVPSYPLRPHDPAFASPLAGYAATRSPR